MWMYKRVPLGRVKLKTPKISWANKISNVEVLRRMGRKLELIEIIISVWKVGISVIYKWKISDLLVKKNLKRFVPVHFRRAV